MNDLELSTRLDAHPRAVLSTTSTSLHELPRLGARLGVDLWVKRDDTFSLAFGGNKVRQLEYYLGQAEAEGADTVLVTGAVQSNFVRLTAAAARVLGLSPVVQLEHRVPRHDAPYLDSGNVLINKLLGAEIHYFDEGEDEQAADANLESIADGLVKKSQRPYIIHLGIDHPPTGGLGYVRGAMELDAQLTEASIAADHVLLASGSGLTHAGLLAGLRALGRDVVVHGICVRRETHLQHPRIERRTREIEALLDIDSVVTDADIVVDDSVLAPGYGFLNDETAEAVRFAAKDEALLLDPVYTGRAMAGLIHRVKTNEIKQGETVVFIHTGGTPGLFGYAEDVMQALDQS